MKNQQVVERLSDKSENAVIASGPHNDTIICPVCGATIVQEKCKVICRSEICRGRVILTCSEF